MTQNNDLIYIALGANLSNPKQTFVAAIQDLKANKIHIEAASSLWRSPAWPPGSDAPDYLNAVIGAKYDSTPENLLHILQSVEQRHGRVRSIRNAPRTLDLDILDFNGLILDQAELTIPHPRMLTRGFVLFPLAEIAPDWRDPASKRLIAEFIATLPLADAEALEPVDREWIEL